MKFGLKVVMIGFIDIVHQIADRMVELTGDYPNAEGVLKRALNQAARELLLLQSSDWAFIMKTGTMVDYAVKRTKNHIHRFNNLYDQIKYNRIDPNYLARLEERDNIFPGTRLSTLSS